MKHFFVLSAIFLTFLIGCFCSSGWTADNAPPTDALSLTAAGSGVNLGITRLLAESFVNQHQNVTVDIPGSIGTKGAITAVADGAIALGLISRPLKEQEKALGIVEQPYACVAIVIGAHESVKENNITGRELNEIFRGTRKQWNDGNPIIVQAREKSDSGFLVLEGNIPGFKEVYAQSHAAKRWTLYYNDQDANRALATTPFAIGVTDLGMIATEHLNIKVLTLDGIVPNQENVLSGTYPLNRRLAFIYRPETISDLAKAFIGFTASEMAHGILRANGYIPLQHQGIP